MKVFSSYYDSDLTNFTEREQGKGTHMLFDDF